MCRFPHSPQVKYSRYLHFFRGGVEISEFLNIMPIFGITIENASKLVQTNLFGPVVLKIAYDIFIKQDTPFH